MPSAARPAASKVSVRVSVVVNEDNSPAPSPRADTSEWEVVTAPPSRVLAPALCARLAARLTSRANLDSSQARVEAAFAAGVQCEVSLAEGTEIVGPPSVGLQNTCWLGVRPTGDLWWTGKRRIADQILKKEASAWLLAFASQTEAEAFCLGLGRSGLPSRR